MNHTWVKICVQKTANMKPRELWIGQRDGHWKSFPSLYVRAILPSKRWCPFPLPLNWAGLGIGFDRYSVAEVTLCHFQAEALTEAWQLLPLSFLRATQEVWTIRWATGTGKHPAPGAWPPQMRHWPREWGRLESASTVQVSRWWRQSQESQLVRPAEELPRWTHPRLQIHEHIK